MVPVPLSFSEETGEGDDPTNENYSLSDDDDDDVASEGQHSVATPTWAGEDNEDLFGCPLFSSEPQATPPTAGKQKREEADTPTAGESVRESERDSDRDNKNKKR